jgi:quercetin dioxygenase-like cupin family protein
MSDRETKMQTGGKEPKVVRPTEGRKLVLTGHELTLKLTSRETGGESYVYEVVTPPGVGMPLHVHRIEDEIIQVIDGDEFDVQIGDRTFKAAPGSLIYFPRGIPHRFLNVGSKPLRTLWTIIPGASYERFIEALATSPEGSMTCVSKVRELFSAYGIDILDSPE